MKTILCPVDRSEISRRAFGYATAIARYEHARLSVLEVIDWALPPVAGVTPMGEVPPEVSDEALAGLHELVAPAQGAGIPTEVCLATGNVVRHILERAHTVSADLIVLGTHGRGGFEHLVLGSVTEKVLRKAPCPVLTVPPGADPVPSAPFSSILCAVDFSEASAEAFKTARALARRGGSQLALLHVVEWPIAHVMSSDSVGDLRRGLEAHAERELAAFVRQHAPSDGEATAVVRTGSSKKEILDFARAQSVDLIVVGITGRGAVDVAVLGSIAHAVIRGAQCPVLTVRATAAARAGE